MRCFAKYWWFHYMRVWYFGDSNTKFAKYQLFQFLFALFYSQCSLRMKYASVISIVTNYLHHLFKKISSLVIHSSFFAWFDLYCVFPISQLCTVAVQWSLMNVVCKALITLNLLCHSMTDYPRMHSYKLSRLRKNVSFSKIKRNFWSLIFSKILQMFLQPINIRTTSSLEDLIPFNGLDILSLIFKCTSQNRAPGFYSELFCQWNKVLKEIWTNSRFYCQQKTKELEFLLSLTGLHWFHHQFLISVRLVLHQQFLNSLILHLVLHHHSGMYRIPQHLLISPDSIYYILPLIVKKTAVRSSSNEEGTHTWTDFYWFENFLFPHQIFPLYKNLQKLFKVTI